jgi:hypothetical protein
VLHNVFYFLFRIFLCTGQRVKEGLQPFIQVSRKFFCQCRTEHLELPAVWMVIAAKDLGISLHFPQAGQNAKVIVH